MHLPIHVRALALAGAFMASAAGRLTSQNVGPPPGWVSGQVYDSLAAGPLVDAAVFLWGTSYRAVTDENGDFTMEGVPPGEYTLLYYHARMGELGISPGPTRIRVQSNDTVNVELGTPSRFTMLASQCLMEERSPGTGVVAGRVEEATSGMGMPHAHVTLSWLTEGSKQPTVLTFETDSEGWYRACEVPSGVAVVATARFMDREGLRREVSVAEGGTTNVAFDLLKLEPSRVTGHVRDAETQDGVGDVEVWLRGTAYRTVTGPEGQFRFGDVPPGTYTMFARHLRYGTRQDTLIVASGQHLDVNMQVSTQAIEMSPITVEVEGTPATERAMGGMTITRASIDKVRGKVRDAADILQRQHIAGIIIRRQRDGRLCVGVIQGQVRMMSDGCVPMTIFINGVRATNTDLALQMPPESIDHMVIYRPVEAGNLFGAGSLNGVLMIYTRSH